MSLIFVLLYTYLQIDKCMLSDMLYIVESKWYNFQFLVNITLQTFEITMCGGSCNIILTKYTWNVPLATWSTRLSCISSTRKLVKKWKQVSPMLFNRLLLTSNSCSEVKCCIASAGNEPTEPPSACDIFKAISEWPTSAKASASMLLIWFSLRSRRLMPRTCLKALALTDCKEPRVIFRSSSSRPNSRKSSAMSADEDSRLTDSDRTLRRLYENMIYKLRC